MHHVHSTLLAQGGSQIGPIERQPSCDEVSVAVMTYLVLLQLSGVKMYVCWICKIKQILMY